MPRNRIIHNVQDVFVGSTPDEADNLVTGIAGHEVLKRLNRVQSFNYSIDLAQEDSLTLGKSRPFSRASNQPPTISLSLNYLLNGVDNERRIGLNVGEAKCLTHDMLTTGTKDPRNIYLAINDKEMDIRQPKTFPNPFVLSKAVVADPNSSNYSLVVFQNCYLTQYSVNVTPQSLPTVDLSYTADNIIGYASGSEIKVPHLNLKSGVVSGDLNKDLIIPQAFGEGLDSDFTKNVTRTSVTISKTGPSGVTGFLGDEITDCSIDGSLERTAESRIGHKLFSDRPPVIPMRSNLQIQTLAKENITGSFLTNMKENEIYNVEVDIMDSESTTLAKYTFSGARFEGISYSSSFGANKTASLKFYTYMDLEERKEGVFIEGKISSAISGSATIYPQY
jgi:hypothetical protein